MWLHRYRYLWVVVLLAAGAFAWTATGLVIGLWYAPEQQRWSPCACVLWADRCEPTDAQACLVRDDWWYDAIRPCYRLEGALGQCASAPPSVRAHNVTVAVRLDPVEGCASAATPGWGVPLRCVSDGETVHVAGTVAPTGTGWAMGGSLAAAIALTVSVLACLVWACDPSCRPLPPPVPPPESHAATALERAAVPDSPTAVRRRPSDESDVYV